MKRLSVGGGGGSNVYLLYNIYEILNFSFIYVTTLYHMHKLYDIGRQDKNNEISERMTREYACGRGLFQRIIAEFY
jgi:hypothetical protein